MEISSLQKGLIAHYPLDGEHLAKDVTPYGNDGTVTGATVEEDGTSFDGTGDYIQLGNVADFGDETEDISGVKIYNRALSADEVKLLYDKGKN